MKVKDFIVRTNSLLYETVKKEGDRYYIYSHKTGKKIGREKGYATASLAIAGLLGMVSKGGFWKKSSEVKKAQINAYMKRHNLK